MVAGFWQDFVRRKTLQRHLKWGYVQAVPVLFLRIWLQSEQVRQVMDAHSFDF